MPTMTPVREAPSPRVAAPARGFEPSVGMILDEDFLNEIIADRRQRGVDKRDEVWDGVYMIMPIANNDHQEIAFELGFAFKSAANTPVKVLVGVNISDQEEDWTKNYREPDVAVFLPGTTAQNRDTHWLGGPDFAVEIISKGDRARQKLDFYAAVNVRELLLVDRYPWSLELYRLREGVYDLVGRSTIEGQVELPSEVLPVSFRLVPGEDRPMIEIIERGGARRWSA